MPLVTRWHPQSPAAVFETPDAGVTGHECKLDEGDWVACFSPWAIEGPDAGLPAGFEGVVSVRAVSGTNAVGTPSSAKVRKGLRPNGFNKPVDSVLGLSDGRVLVAGDFTHMDRDPAGRIIRLLADGSYDPSFHGADTGFDNDVFVATLERGTDGAFTGKVLVGGTFTTYNGAAVPRGLIRLNEDGSWDSTFNTGGAGIGANTLVSAIVVELGTEGLPTGKLLVGGNFDHYNTVTVGALMRVGAGGVLDENYAAGQPMQGLVRVLLQGLTTAGLPDGTLYVGGNMPRVGTTDIGSLVRVLSDGTFDATFAVGAGFAAVWPPNVHALEHDRAATGALTGRILVGGELLKEYQGETGFGENLVRLEPDGARDVSFNQGGTGFNNLVRVVVAERDGAGYTGRYFVGGEFGLYNGSTSTQRGFVRIANDGALDTTFGGSNPAGAAGVVALMQELDCAGGVTGRLVLAGSFAQVNNVAVPSGLTRVSANATPDALWPPGPGFWFPPFGAARQVLHMRDRNGRPDGRLVVIGLFDGFGGVDVPDRLVRLTRYGARDPSFNAIGAGMGCCATDLVEELEVNNRPTGKYLVASSAVQYNGNLSAPDGLFRINGDGNLDTSFNGGGAGFNGTVEAALQLRGPEGAITGRIAVGGWFTAVNGTAGAHGFVALNPNGSPDTTFGADAGAFPAGSHVATLAQDRSDGGYGDLWAGGTFASFGQVDIPDNLARFSTDGVRRAGSGPGFNREVRDLLPQFLPGAGYTGRLLLVGVFDAVNGLTSNEMALVEGDGSLSATWSPGTGNAGVLSTVEAILPELDDNRVPTGRVYIGGVVYNVHGTNVPAGVARLHADGTLDATFNLDGAGGTWVRDLAHARDTEGPVPGAIYVAGDFLQYNRARRPGLVRIDREGLVDDQFMGSTR